MRRLIPLLLLVFFVTASATVVRASTDCERWFATYKQELAHTKSVQRIEAARRRARQYARRKLASYVRPKPTNEPHVPRRQPMSRRETLRHFELACGVLPEESADRPLVSEETPVEFASNRQPSDLLGLIPEEDGGQLPPYVVPPFDGGEGGPGPSGNGPPLYTPPNGGVGGGGGNGPTPPVPPIVPEPSSYVLVLTGLAAVGGMLKRRFNR